MPDPLDLGNLNLGGNQSPPDNQPPPDNTDPNPLHESFLQNIPDEHKDIVSKYVPDWDKQVTQKFQEIHEQYKPYKDLGMEPDMLQAAVQILQFADADPLGFYNYVKEQLIESGIELDENTNDTTPVGNNLPEFEGLPEPLVQKITQMESSFEKFSKFVDDFNAQKESEQNQQQLDNLLKQLHNEHGDFDEPAILGRIMQGMKPEDAVKDYKSKVTSARNSPPPPPTLNNGGTVLDQVDRSKLKDKNFRQSMVTDLLTKAAQQGD